MNSRRVYTIFLRQFLLLKRSPWRIFALFYWTTMELVLWGVLTVYLHRVGGAEFSFITFFIGAIIFWNFLVRMQHGISISFLEDVWVRNFMNLFSSPLTVSEYVAGLMLTSIFTTFVSVLFMVILAWLLFAYNIFQFGLLLIPFIGILFMFGWALGVVTTAIILRLGPSSEILAWSIPALLLPLAGVFYPVSTLPDLLQPVAALLPPTHVFEGMRNVVIAGAFDSGRLLVSFFLSLAFFIAAYWFLLRSYRFVLRKGLFTRFMTE